MHKQSPSRGHKSKGIKVKHVLQICVLLAVCFWLIYQVKHSQEKRREFVAKDEKVVDKVQMNNEILRFGRKDLPRVTEIATSGDKHGEEDDEKEDEEEDENKPEEEENKHEEDEPEQEDGSIVEREEERGGGDDETDEIDLDKKEAEYEHGEEDKEKEDNEGDVEENHDENGEKELPGKEEHFEDEEDEDARKEDHNDHDGDNGDTHEAREEQYKADDASSEVAHHVQNIIPKTENVTLGHANDMFGKVDFGQENETKSSYNPDALIKPNVDPRKDSDHGISNGTIIEQKKFENLTKSEMSRNLTSLNEEHPSLPKGLLTAFNANVSQKDVVKGAPGDKDSNLLGKVLGDNNKPKLAQTSGNPNKTENAYTNGGYSLSSSHLTMASQIANDADATKAEKDGSANTENHDDKNLVNNAKGRSHENSIVGDEDAGVFQHDPIDESDHSDDTNVTEEEKESRVDLETLPDIKAEGHNVEEAMAE